MRSAAISEPVRALLYCIISSSNNTTCSHAKSPRNVSQFLSTLPKFLFIFYAFTLWEKITVFAPDVNENLAVINLGLGGSHGKFTVIVRVSFRVCVPVCCLIVSKKRNGWKRMWEVGVAALRRRGDFRFGFFSYF